MPSIEDSPEGVQLYEYEHGEKAAETITAAISAAELGIEAAPEVVPQIELTWKESICLRQQTTLYQVAIAVLLLTAVRFIMTKGQQRGAKTALKQRR